MLIAVKEEVLAVVRLYGPISLMEEDPDTVRALAELVQEGLIELVSDDEETQVRAVGGELVL